MLTGGCVHVHPPLFASSYTELTVFSSRHVMLYLPLSLFISHLMSIRSSHVVALHAVIENKCGEGECLIGVVRRRGGFVRHLEISSSLCILTV